MTPPLVSVVVPTYDGERYVVEAVRSALAQTFTDLEVLVVDDGSSDDTVRAVSSIDDPRLRVVVGDHCGAAATWNRGVEESAGRLVMVLCQDDRLDPRCIQALVTALTTRPGVVLAAVGRRVVDQNGRVLLPRLRAVAEDRRMSRAEIVRRCVARATNVVGEPSAVLFERAAWMRTGGFRPVGYVIDLDMWLRLLTVGDAAMLASCLSDFRVHRGSWSSALRGSQRESIRALLTETAAESGLRLQRSFGPRVGGRWIGRSLVFGVSRMSRAADAPAAG